MSKTFQRTVALPLASETLVFWIERQLSFLGRSDDGSARVRDAGALLFLWTYRYCCRKLRELGEQEVGEHLHPHRSRHTSASYWATKLDRHQLSARMG